MTDDLLLMGYAGCSTCKKAMKWLEQQGVPYVFRCVKTAPPSHQELKVWWIASGLELRKFFNTSGQVYKSLGLKNQLPHMSEEAQLELLASDGMLVKRPLLIGEDTLLVGFKAQEWHAALQHLF